MKRPSKETLRHVICQMNHQSDYKKFAKLTALLIGIQKASFCYPILFSSDISSHINFFQLKKVLTHIIYKMIF